MLMQPTLEKLRQMGLNGMADALMSQLQQSDLNQWSFEERLSWLVDHEWTYRQNRRLARRLREARLRVAACPEDVDYRTPRGLDGPGFRHLLTCQWLRRRENVVITGPTGVGKTYLACALAHAACREGYSARYYRLPRLLMELLLAKADGSYPKLLTRLARIDLLVLDDWGIAPISAAESRELLEVMDDRSQTRSTLVASQLPLDKWHEVMGDPTVADAVLDRLVHGAHRIVLRGESMRKRTPAPAGTGQTDVEEGGIK